MAAAMPKQYLPLLGEPVLLHTLRALAGHPRIDGIVLALADGDSHWPAVERALRAEFPQLLLRRALGGAERSDSVLAALRSLAELAGDEDWVLVHDAARPCLRGADIDALLHAVQAHGGCGGILATPVRDTMKRVDATGRIQATVPRESLWHALTPQMFRLGALRAALEQARAAGSVVTDEASAMEAAGQQPLAVHGHQDNLKITHPQDLELAALLLQGQRRG